MTLKSLGAQRGVDRSSAPQAQGRRALLKQAAAMAAFAAFMKPLDAMAALNPARELAFFNLHTEERMRIEYWRSGRYSAPALRQIAHLLRDHHNNKTHEIDPRLLDVLFVLHGRVRSREPFHVISGYRSPETNAVMHANSDGVAQHSMHIEGRAIDIRLPGLGLNHLHKAAFDLQAGGVGYYPSDNFIHVDTGPLRHW